MLYKKLLITFLIVCINIIAIAQKPVKGSSPERPWQDDVYTWHPRGEVDDSIHGDRINTIWDMERNSFGKWEFKARYPSFYETIIKDGSDSSQKLIPFLLGIPREVNHLAIYTDTILLTGTDPGNAKITAKIYFTDSLFESYGVKGFLSKETNYEFALFKKLAKGYVRGSAGDSASFNIVMYYQDKDNVLNQSSYICIGNDTIRLKPMFDNNIKVNNFQNSFYSGFNFIQADKIIGGANYGSGFLGSLVYKYWLSPSLEANTSRAIASCIFIIVTYF